MILAFSSSRFCLIDRDIYLGNLLISEGVLSEVWPGGQKAKIKKKNTFSDFISCAKFLIEKKYTFKKKLIALGGSAGGLLIGNVLNKAPELFLGCNKCCSFL